MIRSIRGRVAALAGVCFLGLGAGCVVESSDPVVVVPAGRLIVDWTISDTTDPNTCTLAAAAAIDIVITSPGGAFVSEFQAPCASFATTISTLAPGSYAATAELVDSRGTSRTTPVSIAPFTLSGGDVSIPVDFPADSFF